MPEFQQIGSAVGVNPDYVGAISAFESDWGNQSHRGNNNMFSTLERRRGAFRMIKWQSGNEEKYLIGKWQADMKGVTSLQGFVDVLIATVFTADPPEVYRAGANSRYGEYLYWKPLCN